MRAWGVENREEKRLEPAHQMKKLLNNPGLMSSGSALGGDSDRKGKYKFKSYSKAEIGTHDDTPRRR